MSSPNLATPSGIHDTLNFGGERHLLLIFTLALTQNCTHCHNRIPLWPILSTISQPSNWWETIDGTNLAHFSADTSLPLMPRLKRLPYHPYLPLAPLLQKINPPSHFYNILFHSFRTRAYRWYWPYLPMPPKQKKKKSVFSQNSKGRKQKQSRYN
jgi:hypothetical protein